MTIRTSITDLPNPAKRIGELESELLRVRAALDEARAELAEAYEYDNKQHAAIVRDTLEIGELEADRDALRARLEAVAALADKWGKTRRIDLTLDQCASELRAALAGSEMTK